MAQVLWFFSYIPNEWSWISCPFTDCTCAEGELRSGSDWISHAKSKLDSDKKACTCKTGGTCLCGPSCQCAAAWKCANPVWHVNLSTCLIVVSSVIIVSFCPSYLCNSLLIYPCCAHSWKSIFLTKINTHGRLAKVSLPYILRHKCPAWYSMGGKIPLCCAIASLCILHASCYGIGTIRVRHLHSDSLERNRA